MLEKQRTAKQTSAHGLLMIQPCADADRGAELPSPRVPVSSAQPQPRMFDKNDSQSLNEISTEVATQ